MGLRPDRTDHRAGSFPACARGGETAPARSAEVMPDSADPAVVGVDVGGTKIAAARVVGPDAYELSESATDLSSSTALLDGLEATVREVIERSGEPEAIGVGVPSQVDFESGT